MVLALLLKLGLGTIIGLVLIVVFGSTLTILLGSLTTDLTKDIPTIIDLIFKGSAPTPKPVAGELVCDLKLIVRTELDKSDIPFSEFFIRTPDDVKSYNWRDCHQATDFPLGSLLNLGQSVSDVSQTLSVFPVTIQEGQAVTVDISLKDPNSSVTIDKSVERTLGRSIDLPAGLSVQLPLDLTQTYFIPNIPHRDYILEIDFPNHEINGMSKSKPLIDEVCQFTKMTCLN